MASSAVAILSSSESLPTKPATPAWEAAKEATRLLESETTRTAVPGLLSLIARAAPTPPPALVETEIKQARVGLVPDHRGNALVRGRGDGQRLMTARLERDRERFAKNTIIVTQN